MDEMNQRHNAEVQQAVMQATSAVQRQQAVHPEGPTMPLGRHRAKGTITIYDDAHHVIETYDDFS